MEKENVLVRVWRRLLDLLPNRVEAQTGVQSSFLPLNIEILSTIVLRGTIGTRRSANGWKFQETDFFFRDYSNFL